MNLLKKLFRKEEKTKTGINHDQALSAETASHAYHTEEESITNMAATPAAEDSTADQIADARAAGPGTQDPVSGPETEKQEDITVSGDGPGTVNSIITESPDTVWISPEQAASIIKGDRPLSQDLILPGPRQADRNQNVSDGETGRQEPGDSISKSGRQYQKDPGLETVPKENPNQSAPAGPTDQDSLKETMTDSIEEEEAPVTYRRNRRKGRKKKAAGKIVFSLLVLLAAVYLGGRYFFQTHFLPNTVVDGTDLGLHSQARAREILDKRLKAETLELIEPDENEYLTGADAGLHYVSFDKITDILNKQDSANWFLQLRNHTDYGNLEVAIDQDQLSASVDKLRCLNPDQPKEPENAYIYYNPKKHKYGIKSETYGNLVNKETLLKGLGDAFLSRSPTISMQDQTYYIQADIRKDSEIIQSARKKMNTWLKGTVIYKDGDQELKLSKDEISSFIKLSDDYKVSLDKKKIKKYVKKNVVKTFNSLEGDIPEGLTAWKVDVKEETKDLIKNIKEGKKITRAPVYSSQGLEEDEYNLGKTYIDVNLSQQQMWYVEDGKVAFNSDVVTGNVSAGHATSTGIYHIAYKQRDHMMVKYHSFVHYWMPYNTAVGIGFHDASWRSSFGGEIYRYNGSHGCINMPPPKAEELFNMISSGTTVYVHD